MIPENISQLLSRRKLLRDSVIAATGIVLLPSVITGCSKDGNQLYPGINPKGNFGLWLTQNELADAADNLKRMRVWVLDLYPLCIEYEEAVFHALSSTKQNSSWTNFIVNVFIDIAVLLAAAAAIVSGNAWAVPAIACLSAFLHDWGIGKDKPIGLDAVFAVFEFGHEKTQFAIEQKLSSLVDPTNNYSNLKAAWKDNIEFNGHTYTLGDLASSNFPALGDEYNKLQSAAHTSFKKSLWNLVIMKTCTLYENTHRRLVLHQGSGYRSVTDYARKEFYPANKGVYLRGKVTYIEPGVYRTVDLVDWNLGINGYPFPEEASDILFMDDTPGNIINPDGLFNRSYVFEQFSITKPDFSGGHELGKIVEADFSLPDDWNFTGGVFPKLIK